MTDVDERFKALIYQAIGREVNRNHYHLKPDAVQIEVVTKKCFRLVFPSGYAVNIVLRKEMHVDKAVKTVLANAGWEHYDKDSLQAEMESEKE